MAAPEPPPQSNPRGSTLDPIFRNALRYTVSAKEYQTVHKYLGNQSSPTVKKHVPTPSRYPAACGPNDDFNSAAIRASLRVFVASQAGLTLWDLLKRQFLERNRPARCD